MTCPGRIPYPADACDTAVMNGCECVTDAHLLFPFSKAPQSGGAMLLPCYSQQHPTGLHSRAALHQHAKLRLPSDVSVAFPCRRPPGHREPLVFRPGLKTPDRFPTCRTFLTINLWRVTGQRKELRTHTPLCHSYHTHTCTDRHMHGRFHHRPNAASTGNAPFEYEWTWKGAGNWMQFCALRESNTLGFCNWVCFSFACHALACFSIILCPQTCRSDLIC